MSHTVDIQTHWATWHTIARSPKPTKSIRSEAKHCERPTSLTHFIELRLQWRLEVHIEITVIYLDLSNGDGLHWIRPTERIFVQYSDQKKTVCSIRQPTKHDCLFICFLLRFLLRQLNQSGIITVCAFQRLSTFNALNWILSTGYWIYSQVYIVWALRQHNRPFQRWNQNTVIESTVDTHENPIINEKIGAKVDVIKYM